MNMKINRRLLVYIIPVTLLSFALNIPKFIEVTIQKRVKINCIKSDPWIKV